MNKRINTHQLRGVAKNTEDSTRRSREWEGNRSSSSSVRLVEQQIFMLCGASKHCNYKTIGLSYRHTHTHTCFPTWTCSWAKGLSTPYAKCQHYNSRYCCPAAAAAAHLMAVSCRRPSSHYASVWGCQRNYWTMLTTAGAATLGHGRLVCPAALSLRSVSFFVSYA